MAYHCDGCGGFLWWMVDRRKRWEMSRKGGLDVIKKWRSVGG